MRVKVFKATLVLTAALFGIAAGFAQQAPKVPVLPQGPKQDDKVPELNLNNLGTDLNLDLKNAGITLNNIAPNVIVSGNGPNRSLCVNLSPKINIQLNDLNLDLNDSEPQINLELNDQNTSEANSSVKSVKFKTYSKSYPIDGNDKIKLSNQYGRITVNTWDRREMKVDVQIKAEANDDSGAQKLLDGVQIRDSKDGDLVSFRTSIAPFSNSFRLWNLGRNNKHKIEINYTVYMPSRTDLNVEDSYGAIVLPDLQGRVRISSSYGSVTAENLTNPANQVEGSYGSLKMGVLNGGHLDYSYGNVEIGECNNLKAALSYGSFKLGKLKGWADMDLSFVRGFKIVEVDETLKRLNINSTYSGISLGVPGNNNFDFDVTTTYGGFHYNDDKVTITDKTPSDNKRYSSTKNFRGHVGKGAAAAQVNIKSSYGSVNFE